MIQKLKITVLIENHAGREDLLAEHGLSLWIEADNRCLLFDTGQSGAFVDNAGMLGIDLGDTEAVVLSHGHYDHGGGLAEAPERFHGVPLYVHPAAFDGKYSVTPEQGGRYNGAAFGGLEAIRAAIPGTVLTEQPTEILPGVWATGTIPRRHVYEVTGGPFYRDAEGTTPDPLMDDQALYIETEQGVVVLLGCAHAGMVNTLDYVADLTGRKSIAALIGGMHLIRASEGRMKKTLAALRMYDVRRIGPCHCTGGEAIERMKGEFGERVIEPAGGAVIEF